jgi:hypothetical protein
MLARSIAFEGFKSIAWRCTEIGKQMRGVQKTELASSDFDQIGGETFADHAIECVFRQRVPETLDHGIVYQVLIQMSMLLYHILIHPVGWVERGETDPLLARS